ncbi:hypothetical protein SAMN05421736_101144 [Evansella caseinilytica]|uniref:Uncharacterized protein n=1 Tax=Evansella caseinilytica TaxID=1503961 RepID=A0A1H3GFY5_9BACI|nr:hypothetical protein [Evansella caseinilytica]SDY01558.1 hypothetical protein SAMN05421736_101144 [Evansella caseinilytica]
MKFKSLLVSCFTVAFLLMGVFSAQANGTTDKELEKQFETALESVDSYIEWIQEQIENGEGTSEQLDSFKSLSSEEQEAFIEVLKHQDTYFAPLDEPNESDMRYNIQSFNSTTPSLLLTAPNITRSIDVEVNGVTLPLTLDFSEDETEQPSFTTLSTNKSKTVTSEYTLKLGSVTITSFTTWVKFEHGTTKATKYLAGNHSHTNLNPGMIISKDGGDGYLSNGYA